MSKIKYIILGALLAAAFFYNPPKEDYYDRLLDDKAGLGGEFLSDIKHKLVEEAYEYNNYFLFGTLTEKSSGNVQYYGAAGFIFNP